LCLHQWQEKRGKKICYLNYYNEYLYGRKTLKEIAESLDISTRTLSDKFDLLKIECAIPKSRSHAINLLIDATFFGREYGYLCFHDNKNIIYFEEIKSESVAAFRSAFYKLINAGIRFKSFTIDGKRGFIQTLKRIFPATPIQMCHFHQKAIIRRYITNNPKTQCGVELKSLMNKLSSDEPQNFIDQFYSLQAKYAEFLKEKNDNNQYVHRRLRSAIRSIKSNLPYLFVYKEINANIPHTTNKLEGTFSHLKEKIRIHRGMSKNRKKKAARFILINS